MTIKFNNSVFIHIPRTGGVWFRKAVQEANIPCLILSGHYDSHLDIGSLPLDWFLEPTFTFVRHPLAWLGSRWSKAVEDNTSGQGTFFHVHRTFDDCVKPTLVETVKQLISKSPGIVSDTYLEMTDSVDNIYRTEDLPRAAILALNKYEILTEEQVAKVSSIEKYNSTSTMSRYQEEIKSLPKELVQEFLSFESVALSIWEGANRA